MNNQNPKTILYVYMFILSEEAFFNNKVVEGASLDVAIKPLKDNKEIKFTNEVSTESYTLSDVFTVSFDRERLFTITKNDKIYDKFCSDFGWDDITTDVVGYSLDVCREKDSMIEPMPVSEEVFRKFLYEHKDRFDTSTNTNAQVPSYGFVD